MRFFFIGLIRLYKFTVSPLLGNCCRFWPSCSSYAIEAFTVHNLGKAIWLVSRRVLRCSFLSRGGCDPVPGGPSEESLTLFQAESDSPEDR
jgi:putative membrane protein insertion efficiency factor